MFREAQDGILIFLSVALSAARLCYRVQVSRKITRTRIGGGGARIRWYVQVGYLVLVDHRFSRVASQDVARRSHHIDRKEKSYFPRVSSAIIRHFLREIDTRSISRPHAAMCILPISIYINSINSYSRVAEEKPGVVRFPLRKQMHFVPLYILWLDL